MTTQSMRRKRDALEIASINGRRGAAKDLADAEMELRAAQLRAARKAGKVGGRLDGFDWTEIRVSPRGRRCSADICSVSVTRNKGRARVLIMIGVDVLRDLGWALNERVAVRVDLVRGALLMRPDSTGLLLHPRSKLSSKVAVTWPDQSVALRRMNAVRHEIVGDQLLLTETGL